MRGRYEEERGRPGNCLDADACEKSSFINLDVFALRKVDK